MSSCLQQCARDTVSASAVCIAVDPCLWEPQARGTPLLSRPASSTTKPSVLFVDMNSPLGSASGQAMILRCFRSEGVLEAIAAALVPHDHGPLHVDIGHVRKRGVPGLRGQEELGVQVHDLPVSPAIGGGAGPLRGHRPALLFAGPAHPVQGDALLPLLVGDVVHVETAFEGDAAHVVLVAGDGAVVPNVVVAPQVIEGGVVVADASLLNLLLAKASMAFSSQLENDAKAVPSDTYQFVVARGKTM